MFNSILLKIYILKFISNNNSLILYKYCCKRKLNLNIIFLPMLYPFKEYLLKNAVIILVPNGVTKPHKKLINVSFIK